MRQATKSPYAEFLLRFVHIVTAIFVLAYIVFNLLDLDLSDFPLRHSPRQRVVLVAETPKAVKLATVSQPQFLRVEPIVNHPSFVRDSAALKFKSTRRLIIRFARAHLQSIHTTSSTASDLSPA